jgi:hypothetical protein
MADHTVTTNIYRCRAMPDAKKNAAQLRGVV